MREGAREREIREGAREKETRKRDKRERDVRRGEVQCAVKGEVVCHSVRLPAPGSSSTSSIVAASVLVERANSLIKGGLTGENSVNSHVPASPGSRRI